MLLSAAVRTARHPRGQLRRERELLLEEEPPDEPRVLPEALRDPPDVLLELPDAPRLRVRSSTSPVRASSAAWVESSDVIPRPMLRRLPELPAVLRPDALRLLPVPPDALREPALRELPELDERPELAERPPLAERLLPVLRELPLALREPERELLPPLAPIPPLSLPAMESSGSSYTRRAHDACRGAEGM